ncbi:MAG: hypothetical protein UH249_11815, partial [Acutalibacteraceae bacterium]|nr:hypothetical protein [Acutalibacteraceae bacterium]
MMKRILSSILAIILLLSMCCVSAAEDNTWTADMESKHYILNQLGIVEIEGAVPYVTLTGDAQQVLSYMVSDEHTDFKDISKSAFVNFLCNIIGNYGFNDQANDEAIEIAEGYGIIHKGQDDLYKSLTYEEALTMLVRLLGYGEHAEMGGGFPQGYISIATRLGLNKGITAGVGENLKVHEAITLLYNAINCAYVEIMWFTNEEIVYGDTSDKTLLYEFRKIYRIEGVVEATGTAALSDSKAVGAQQTMIDGYIYNTNVDLTDMLGLEVEAYVQEDSKNGDVVLFVFPHKNNKQLTITDENIIAVSEDFRQISYYDKNDRKKEAVISPIAKVLYNGQPLAKYTEDKFKPEDGSIMLIENDGSTGYDIVHIQSFKTVVVGSVSPSNLTVGNAYSYDENNQIINLEAKTDDVIRIFDAEGKETEISALLPGDVLRVAESAGSSRRTVTVYVSS